MSKNSPKTLFDRLLSQNNDERIQAWQELSKGEGSQDVVDFYSKILKICSDTDQDAGLTEQNKYDIKERYSSYLGAALLNKRIIADALTAAVKLCNESNGQNTFAGFLIVQCVKEFIKSPIKIPYRNHKGENPIELLNPSLHKSLVGLFFSQETTIEAYTNNLFLAIAISDDKYLKTALHALFSQNVDLNALRLSGDIELQSPLKAAIKCGNKSILRSLLYYMTFRTNGPSRKDLLDSNLLLLPELLNDKNKNLLLYFIREGDYENIDLSSIQSNSLYPILNKSNELQKLITTGAKISFVQINQILSDGGIITKKSLGYFIQALVNNHSFAQQAEIDQIITLFVKNHSDIYTPINNKTLLQLVVENIKDGASLIYIEAAISLIKNRCSINLSDELKSELIKAVISHSPNHLNILITNGLLSKDLKLDGKSLPDYINESSLSADLKTTVITTLKEESEIEKKKAKFLKERLFYDSKDLSELKPEQSSIISEEMVDGATTKKNTAKFKIAKDSKDKERILLVKTDFPIESKFGSDIFRILSNKQFATKQESLIRNEDGSIEHAVKWDKSINNTFFLNKKNELIDDSRNDEKFKRNYARMCGVLQVLGEADRNWGNFLKSKKTGRPIKIDNTFTINNYPGFPSEYTSVDDPNAPPNSKSGLQLGERFSVLGSSQSRGLLFTLAGKDAESPNKVDALLKRPLSNAEDYINYSRAFNEDFNDGINDELLEAIKANIEKPENSALKDQFIEFMKGISDSIELGNDTTFFDQYIKKYEDLGDMAVFEAKRFLNQYQKNIESTKKQFDSFFKYYETLTKAIENMPLQTLSPDQAFSTTQTVLSLPPIASTASIASTDSSTASTTSIKATLPPLDKSTSSLLPVNKELTAIKIDLLPAAIAPTILENKASVVTVVNSTLEDAGIKPFSTSSISTPSTSISPKGKTVSLENKVTIAQKVDNIITSRVPIADEKDKELETKIEEALATQKSNHNPTSAYRGIGVGSEVKKFDNKVIIEITEIYAPEEIKRFKLVGGDKCQDLVGKRIIEVFDNKKNQWLKINDIFKGDENNQAGLKEIANIFHDKGAIKFKTTSDSKRIEEYSCNRDINSVFVTNNCLEAKEALSKKDAKITGDLYSAKNYGINALKGLSEKNLSESIAAQKSH